MRICTSLLALAALSSLLAACQVGGTSSTSSASPSPQLSPSPSPVACTTGGAASADWASAHSSTSTAGAIVSAGVSGDTLTLTFDQGTPSFEVTTQSTANFTATDGRGGPVNLAGNAGVLIILRGFRGDIQNYTGQKDFLTQGKVLVEAREIGEYEGVMGWAAGLSAPGCAGVTIGSSTLTFHFRPGS